MSLPLPSTFMPLPLAMMIPFMGIQSAVMAKQFGEGFQYGKRRISAMTNEEFNKLTFEQLVINTNNEIKLLIPTFAESLREMRPFQREIFTEMLAAMKELIVLGGDVAAAGLDPLAHLLGQHIHSAEQTFDPNQDPTKFQPPTESVSIPQEDDPTKFQPPTESVSTPVPEPISVFTTSEKHYFWRFHTYTIYLSNVKKAIAAGGKTVSMDTLLQQEKVIQIEWDKAKNWITANSTWEKYGDWIKAGRPR